VAQRPILGQCDFVVKVYIYNTILYTHKYPAGLLCRNDLRVAKPLATQETNVHDLNVIRTRETNNPAAIDLCVRPRGQRSKSKGKAVPLQTLKGPEGSRNLRFPDLMTTAQDGGKVVSLTQRPHSAPGNAPGTDLC